MSAHSIIETLRRALAQHGEPRAHVSRETGIGEPALSRFVSGERGLAPENLDRLAAYLGLRLVPSKTPRRKKL